MYNYEIINSKFINALRGYGAAYAAIFGAILNVLLILHLAEDKCKRLMAFNNKFIALQEVIYD